MQEHNPPVMPDRRAVAVREGTRWALKIASAGTATVLIAAGRGTDRWMRRYIANTVVRRSILSFLLLIALLVTFRAFAGDDTRDGRAKGTGPQPAPLSVVTAQARPIAAAINTSHAATSQPAVDEQLYLLLNLRYAYLFMPSDRGDAAAFERELGERRYAANRYLAYAKSKGFDPQLIDLYADLVKAIDIVTDISVKSGRINRDAVVQEELIRKNGDTDTSVTIGASVGAAPATDGMSLIAGADKLIKQNRSKQSALMQLDEAKRRALEDAQREADRELSSFIAKAEISGAELAEKHHWPVTASGLADLADDIKYINGPNSGQNLPALVVWAQQQTIRRPQDPMSVTLAATYSLLLPNVPPKAFAESGERVAFAASLVPPGEVFNKDRGLYILMGAKLMTTAAIGEMLDVDWTAQRSDYGVRAVELFDSAERYVNIAAVDDSGDARLSRVKALARAGRLQEAVSQANDISDLKKSDPEYAVIMAVLLAHTNRPEEAIKWLVCALGNAPDDIVAGARNYPAFATLRQAKPEAFADLFKVKYDWDIKWGVFSDDIVLTNRSAFPITNVVFKLRIENGSKQYPVELKINRLASGESHIFTGAVYVVGSKYERAPSTLICNQDGR